MSGAVPCLSTDLTTHAVPHLIQAFQMGRRAAPNARGAELAMAVMMTLCADRAMGEGAKRGKVSEVLFGARRRATARSATRTAARRRAKFSSARGGGRGRGGDVFLGACRRRRRRGGLQLYQLWAAWGATGQLSGIWLGLWVSASGGVARRRRTPRPQAAAARAAAGHGGPPPQGGRRCRAGPQAAAAGRPRLQGGRRVAAGGRRRPLATRVSTTACVLPRGEAEEARRDLGGN